MKTAVLLFAGLAAAQFSQLPTCAQSCANTYLQRGIGSCGVDVKCICSDNEFIAGIACCLAQPGGCDTADQSAAVVFASQLCAAQGVTVPAAVSCAATASPAATSGASAATTTGSGAAASATATEAASGATAVTATGATTAATASAAATTAASNPAARETAVGAGVLGGIIAALAML